VIALAAGALAAETARSAASFVDSIGVNTHFSYWDTPYGKRFDEVARLLERSGIRHVRDSVVLGQTRVCDEERTLAATGIRFDYITQPALRPADLTAWASCVGPAIESYEGPNEYDISHPQADGDWARTVRTFQRTLYGAVKGSAALRDLPVIGPSLTSKGAFDAVGDLSAYLDAGNVHDYFAGHEPETPGFGPGGYGSIAYNLGIAAAVSRAKPVEATETGYGTAAQPGNVSEAVQAAYVPRMFLDQFLAGIVRTDEYELVDEGGPPYSAMGLLASDLRPKPAFTALSAMIGLLHGDGSLGTLARVPLALAGDTANVRHALFETAPDRCYVALWQATASVEPRLHVPLPVPERRVRVELGRPWTAGRVFTYDDAGRLAGVPARERASVPVALGERVVFVELARTAAAR
jgi:hypothetical protein